MGQGDGLVNQILLEPYWETFLQETYDNRYQQNLTEYTQKFYRLDDLQTLQAQWREEREPQQKPSSPSSSRPWRTNWTRPKTSCSATRRSATRSTTACSTTWATRRKTGCAA